MDTQVAPSLEGSEGETGNWPCDASFRLPASILYSLTAAEVTSAVASGFGDASLLGFDIEWRPNFSPGEDNDTAVVQLATDDACLVAHVAHMKDARTRRGPHLPAALREVLENTNVIKCGVGIAKDLQKLADDEVTGELWAATGGVATAGFIDLGVLAWAHAIPAVGLKTLTAFFGHTLKKSKSISTSNWEARSLRGDQIYYAAQDAYAAVWILHQLHRHVSGSYAAHPSQILDWLHPFINVATIAALVDASERGLSLPASTVEVIAEHREELARRARAKADKRAKRRDGGQAAYGYHGRR